MNKNIKIENLLSFKVSREEDAIELYDKGERKRKFASTEINQNSSRSHAIFRIELRVIQRNFIRTYAQINMVDLAGSEGVSKTKAEGVTKKEGESINKSLLALSNVIRQLS